jgi:hypothetical protein
MDAAVFAEDRENSATATDARESTQANPSRVCSAEGFTVSRQGVKDPSVCGPRTRRRWSPSPSPPRTPRPRSLKESVACSRMSLASRRMELVEGPTLADRIEDSWRLCG